MKVVLRYIKKILTKMANALPDYEMKGNDQTDGYIIIGDQHNIAIGRNVSFGGNVTLFANSTIEIGDHTMIGINTLLHTSTHSYNQQPMWKERIDRPIKIGSNVWIGANTIIAPGVIIEDYAVIGMGSVVASNVPRNAIVAGNPARIIRFRIDHEDTDKQQLDYPQGAYITKLGYLERYCVEKKP